MSSAVGQNYLQDVALWLWVTDGHSKQGTIRRVRSLFDVRLFVYFLSACVFLHVCLVLHI